MPTYIRGRSQRIQRRREIIARLFVLADKLASTDIHSNAAEQPLNEHRTLLLELTELNAIDDQKISVRKS